MSRHSAVLGDAQLLHRTQHEHPRKPSGRASTARFQHAAQLATVARTSGSASGEGAAASESPCRPRRRRGLVASPRSRASASCTAMRVSQVEKRDWPANDAMGGGASVRLTAHVLGLVLALEDGARSAERAGCGGAWHLEVTRITTQERARAGPRRSGRRPSAALHVLPRPGSLAQQRRSRRDRVESSLDHTSATQPTARGSSELAQPATPHRGQPGRWSKLATSQSKTDTRCRGKQSCRTATHSARFPSIATEGGPRLGQCRDVTCSSDIDSANGHLRPQKEHDHGQ